MEHTVTDHFLQAIFKEYLRASEKFGAFASPHEGASIIREEYEELWEEVKKQYEDRSLKLMRKEAIQLGAMALRFLVDLCPVEE